MAAILGTSTNLLTGTRAFSEVTNTYAGYFESDSNAYNLTLPWQADKLEIFNYTLFGTNDKTLQSVWFRDFPAGDALITTRGTTTLSTTLETTNGVTINNTASAFTDEHVTITGVTTATPGVVTAASHGLSNNDRFFITKMDDAIGDELNNRQYVAQNVATNTLEMFDVHGNAITVAGSYSASGGQINKIFAEGDTENSLPIYQLTLGTAVVGEDSSIMYFVAYKYNTYYNLGDIA